MVSRPEFWWPEVFWVTEPGHAFFEVVHEDEHGRADGYVSYEIKGEWHGGVADRQLHVWDIQAISAATRAALWEYVFGVDLIVSVTATNLPPDEPLRFLLADSRRLRTDYLIDSVWVLPLDVAALLASRTYSASGKLVIEIVDPDGSRTQVALDGGPEGSSAAEQPAPPAALLLARTPRRGVAGRDLVGDARRGGRRRRAHARCDRSRRRDVRNRARAATMSAGSDRLRLASGVEVDTVSRASHPEARCFGKAHCASASSRRLSHKRFSCSIPPRSTTPRLKATPSS